MKRCVVLLVLALCAAGLMVPSQASSAEASPVAPGARTAAGSSVAWGRCASPGLAYQGLQCGSLDVPLDYANPAAGTVRLALTRKLHSSPDSQYLGIMLTNPGGPGASGLTLPVYSKYVPAGAGERYDWIGLDPRGVGASTPSLRCWNGYNRTDRPSYTPRNKRLTRQWRTRTARYAAACGTSTARDLLPHLRTTNTVHDMESIRAALGAERLNFYGFSYGSYLGQVYATTFPTRVGRFVLDGVVNPGRVWYGSNQDQNIAFDANLNAFWRYIARHPRAFKLGRSWKKIRRGYRGQLRKLERRPAAGRRLGPDELADVMLDAGYYVFNWVTLARSYSTLVRRGNGRALFQRYRATSMGDDNSYAVYNAVQCTDAPWPGWQQTRADARRLHRSSPFLTWGNTWYNAPCMSWPVPAGSPTAVTGAAVTTPILLVSETGDAATPFSGAIETRRRFPTASLIAGLGGTTHSASLSGVDCVDDTIAAYLATGAVPARLGGDTADLVCPAVPAPRPGYRGWRTGPRPGVSGGIPAELRADLMRAQRPPFGS